MKPNVVVMVSATGVPSQDVLEQQTTDTALMEFIDYSVCLDSIARKLVLPFFHKIKTTPFWGVYFKIQRTESLECYREA